MKLIDIMLKRRSIRKYKNDEIPKEKLDKIIEAGLLAPTSRNRKPCEFLIVKDEHLINQLSKSKDLGSQFLKSAKVTIVVIANSEIDTWIEDSSIALSFMHLMSTEQEIGSCWCQIHLRKTANNEDSEEYVKNLLNLEDKYRIVGILGLGIPDIELKPYTLENLDYTKVKYI